MEPMLEFDHYAERDLLCSLLAYPAILESPNPRPSPIIFHDNLLRSIYVTVLRLLDEGQYPTAAVILARMRHDGPDEEGLFNVLADLTQPGGNSLDVQGLVTTLESYVDRRRLLTLAKRIAVLAQEEGPTDELHAKVLASVADHFEDSAKTVSPVAREVYSAAALCSMEVPTTLWLVDGYMLAGGVSVQFGQGGTGKTIGNIDTGLSVCTGGTAMGREVHRRGSVLYLGPDMDRKLYQRWLLDLCAGRGINPPENFILDLSPVDLSDPGTVERIIHQALSNQAVLVIYDALHCMLGNLDENSNSDMARVMGAIRQISVATGAHSRVSHHWNKNELAAIHNRGRGAGSIRDSADTTFIMSCKGSGAGRSYFLEIDKTRSEPIPNKVEVFLEPGTAGGKVLTFGGSTVRVDRSQSSAESAMAAVLDILRDHGGVGFTRDELTRRLEGQDISVGYRTMTDVLGGIEREVGVRRGKRGRLATYSWDGGQSTLPFDGGEDGA